VFFSVPIIRLVIVSQPPSAVLDRAAFLWVSALCILLLHGQFAPCQQVAAYNTKPTRAAAAALRKEARRNEALLRTVEHHAYDPYAPAEVDDDDGGVATNGADGGSRVTTGPSANLADRRARGEMERDERTDMATLLLASTPGDQAGSKGGGSGERAKTRQEPQQGEGRAKVMSPSILHGWCMHLICK
jgi:hypothetical protein